MTGADKYSRGQRQGKERLSGRAKWGWINEQMTPELLDAQERERAELGTTDAIGPFSLTPPGAGVGGGLAVSGVRAESGPWSGSRPYSFSVRGDVGDEEEGLVVKRYPTEASAAAAQERAVELVRRLAAPEALEAIRKL